MTSSKVMMGLLLVAVFAITTTSVLNSTYAESKTINADKVTIKKGEDITINVNGGSGSKGDKGDSGAAGVAGVQGEPGPAGAQGPAGPQGNNGTGVSAEDMATLQTVIQLYNNGSLASVSVSAENVTTPAPITNETTTPVSNETTTTPPISNETTTTPPVNETTTFPPINETAPQAENTTTTTTTNTTTTDNGTSTSNSTSETIPTGFNQLANFYGF